LPGYSAPCGSCGPRREAAFPGQYGVVAIPSGSADQAMLPLIGLDDELSALREEVPRLRAENARLLRLLELTPRQARPPGPVQTGVFDGQPGPVHAGSTPVASSRATGAQAVAVCVCSMSPLGHQLMHTQCLRELWLACPLSASATARPGIPAPKGRQLRRDDPSSDGPTGFERACRRATPRSGDGSSRCGSSPGRWRCCHTSAARPSPRRAPGPDGARTVRR
jgi:hypothetical protein